MPMLHGIVHNQVNFCRFEKEIQVLSSHFTTNLKSKEKILKILKQIKSNLFYFIHGQINIRKKHIV